jgi:hypothetical protein
LILWRDSPMASAIDAASKPLFGIQSSDIISLLYR